MIIKAAARLMAGSQRTPQQIKSLPKFSVSVAESVYKLSDEVYVDNKDGLGQTPNNEAILYFGFVTVLQVSDFFKLAAPDPNVATRAASLASRIHSGFGIGSPSLTLDVSAYVRSSEGEGQVEPSVVVGHEGRARVYALSEHFGIHQLPVQIFLRGYKARRIADKSAFLLHLQSGVVSETGTLRKNIFNSLIFG